MKKIVALLLSLLMLLGCAALAESSEKTAAIMNLSNIQLSSGGETHGLGDLVVSAILDAAGDPTFVLTADTGSEYLAALAAKITTDGKLAVTVEGVDATYTGDIAALAQQSGTDAGTISQFTSALPELPTAMKQLIPALDQLVLPPFSGVTLPKLDFSALLAGFVTGEADGVTSFTIPYEQFVALLDMVSEYAGMLGSQVPNIDQLTGLIDQMKANGQGFAVDGAIQDDGATQTVIFNLLPVQNGATSETPVFALVVETAENNLSVSAAQNADSAPMITLSVTSDPAAPRLDADLNAMGSTMAFRMYPDDGLQVVEFSANAGDNVSVLFSYGARDGVDVLDLTANASAGTFQMTFNTVKGDDGLRSGTVELNAGGVSATADIDMYLDAASPVEIAWPETEKDLSELDNSVMQTALAPLAEYINGLEATA